MQHRSAEPNSVMDDEDNGEQVERDSVAPRQKMLVHAMLGGILRKYWGWHLVAGVCQYRQAALGRFANYIQLPFGLQTRQWEIPYKWRS